MTIYLDAVWTLNVLLDFMLLMLTGAIIKIRIHKRRLLFGAFIASLIVPVTFYFPDFFLTSLYGKVGFSIIIILSTFGWNSLARVLKLLVTFYFVSFAIGGGLIATHYMLQSSVDISSTAILTVNQGYGDPISWIFILIGFPASWLFTKWRLDKHAIDKIRYDQLYEVKIKMNGQNFETKGYIDSGNQLVCPLTKKPVVICDERFLKQWFTSEEWIQLKTVHNDLDFDHIPKKWEKLLNIVPYQGVEGTSSFLLALQPEELSVNYGETDIRVNNVLIGIQFGHLTEDSLYHCLLHPQIIKLTAVDSA